MAIPLPTEGQAPGPCAPVCASAHVWAAAGSVRAHMHTPVWPWDLQFPDGTVRNRERWRKGV